MRIFMKFLYMLLNLTNFLIKNKISSLGKANLFLLGYFIVKRGNYSMEYLENQEIIEKFTEKKIDSLAINEILIDYYGRSNKNKRKASKVMNCSSFLLFRNYFDPERTKKLKSANFCKHPLCIMCAWRLHLKRVLILERALDVLRVDNPEIKLYFLNLTVKNWDKIRKSKLQDLQRRAVSFIRKKLLVDSYYCSTEITISEKYNNYHPHIHCIIATEQNFDLSLSGIRDLRETWAKVYGEKEYDFLEVTLYPIRENSVNEVTKYILKPERKITVDKVIDIATSVNGLKKSFTAGLIRRYIRILSEGISFEEDAFMDKLGRFKYVDEFYKWINNKYLLQSLEE